MENNQLPINNPAERLLKILERASVASRESSIAEVLCQAMEVENNLDSFLQNSSRVFTLIDLTEKQINQFFPSSKHKGSSEILKQIKIYLAKAIQQSFAPNNENRWKMQVI